MAAWAALVNQHAEKAFYRVSGDFAVALHLGERIIRLRRFDLQWNPCAIILGSELSYAQRADDLVDANIKLEPQAIFDFCTS